MGLPKNGDKVKDLKCPNCDMIFDDEEELGKLHHCKADEGGCGWIFKIIVPKKLEVKE